MAQFDVYRNANPATRKLAPYLVDLQHDLLAGLATRVVAPLLRVNEVRRSISRLNLLVQVAGERVVVSTQELAGVPQTAFGERVGSLATHRAELVAALDLLFTGI